MSYQIKHSKKIISDLEYILQAKIQTSNEFFETEHKFFQKNKSIIKFIYETDKHTFDAMKESIVCTFSKIHFEVYEILLSTKDSQNMEVFKLNTINAINRKYNYLDNKGLEVIVNTLNNVYNQISKTNSTLKSSKNHTQNILLGLKEDIVKAPSIIYDNQIIRLNKIKMKVDIEEYNKLLNFTVVYLSDYFKKRINNEIELYPDNLHISYENFTFKNSYEEYKYVLNSLKNIADENSIIKLNDTIHFLEQNNNSKSCYIATLVYKDIDHPKVEFLRQFRDNKLSKTKFGQNFILFYYKNAPYWVRFLKGRDEINSLIRFILNCLVKLLYIQKK